MKKIIPVLAALLAVSLLTFGASAQYVPRPSDDLGDTPPISLFAFGAKSGTTFGSGYEELGGLIVNRVGSGNVGALTFDFSVEAGEFILDGLNSFVGYKFVFSDLDWSASANHISGPHTTFYVLIPGLDSSVSLQKAFVYEQTGADTVIQTNSNFSFGQSRLYYWDYRNLLNSYVVPAFSSGGVMIDIAPTSADHEVTVYIRTQYLDTPGRLDSFEKDGTFIDKTVSGFEVFEDIFDAPLVIALSTLVVGSIAFTLFGRWVLHL